MAIVGTDQEDEENKLVQPTTSSSPNAHAASDAAKGVSYGGASGGGLVGGAGTGSGQGATTGVASSGVPTAGGSPNPGGYTNLSQYLAVNQGGGATAGKAATNVVQQSADAATQAQNAYNTSATGDINNATSAVAVDQGNIDKIKAGTQNVDQATIDKINASAYGYNPDQNVLGKIGSADQASLDAMVQAGKDASAWSYGGPSDFSKVAYGGPTIDQLTTAYGGPNTTSNFTGQTAANQTEAIGRDQIVEGNAKNAQGGHSGVSALLKEAYQQPQYSAGENNLDAFLAGGTEGGQQALAQAEGIGQGVTNSYSKINDALGGAIQKGKDTATATNKAYKDAANAGVATSSATQGKYASAVQSVKDRSAAAQKTATDAAGKAKAEIDRRAAEAAAKKAADTKKSPTVVKDIVDAVKKAGGDVAKATKKVTNPLVSDIKNMPSNLVNAPKTLVNNVGGALSGNQHALNDLATSVMTGGANILLPSTTAGVTNTAKKVGGQISDTTKRWGLAHGGEVPSRACYGNLVARLRGRK